MTPPDLPTHVQSEAGDEVSAATGSTTRASSSVKQTRMINTRTGEVRGAGGGQHLSQGGREGGRARTATAEEAAAGCVALVPAGGLR